METIKRVCRYFYYRFIRLKASPEKLAWGMALGMFISTTPTFGIQMALGVVLAAIFRVSKLAAVIGVQVTNAFTAPLIYAGTYYLGALILNKPFKKEYLENISLSSLWDLGPAVFASLWVGGVIVGVILAFIGYFMVIGIDTKAHLQIVRAKRQLERVKRKNAPALEKID